MNSAEKNQAATKIKICAGSARAFAYEMIVAGFFMFNNVKLMFREFSTTKYADTDPCQLIMLEKCQKREHYVKAFTTGFVSY